MTHIENPTRRLAPGLEHRLQRTTKERLRRTDLHHETQYCSTKRQHEDNNDGDTEAVRPQKRYRIDTKGSMLFRHVEGRSSGSSSCSRGDRGGSAGEQKRNLTQWARDLIEKFCRESLDNGVNVGGVHMPALMDGASAGDAAPRARDESTPAHFTSIEYPSGDTESDSFVSLLDIDRPISLLTDDSDMVAGLSHSAGEFDEFTSPAAFVVPSDAVRRIRREQRTRKWYNFKRNF